MELTAFGLTDVGQVRTHNEDSILLEPSLNLYAVADGMGGHKGGEFASRICLDTMKDYLQMTAKGHAPLVGEADKVYSETANLLGSAVRFANQALFVFILLRRFRNNYFSHCWRNKKQIFLTA